MDLAFINQTGSPSNDKSTQKHIRKHVMRDIGKARRKPGRPYKQKTLQFSLEIPETPQFLEPDVGDYQSSDAPSMGSQYNVANLESALDPNQSSAHVPRQPPSQALIPHQEDQQHGYVPAIQRVWTGRMDPFIKYPIEMTHDTLRLIDHVFDDRYGNIPPFRDAWLPVGLLDPASFHQVLSNAALNISSLKSTTNAPESFESIMHHTKAVTLVRDRLADPNKVITDGLISAIVGFACYRHGIGDLRGWRMHINAVKELTRQRGGVEVLNPNRLVRLVLFWIDLGGSATGDTVPNFPLPFYFLPKEARWNLSDPISINQQIISQRWRSQFPTQVKIIDIFETISRFSSYLSKAAAETRGEIYKNGEFAAMYLSPILHELLSLSDEYAVVDTEDQCSVLREVLRLSCILYLAEIRRLCGIMAVMSMKHVEKLRSLLSVIKDDPSIWRNGFEELMSWCLAMGGMEATTKADRDWFLSELSQQPHGEGEDFEAIKSIMWYYEAHGPLFNGFLAGAIPDAEARRHRTRNWLRTEPGFLYLIESRDRVLGLTSTYEASK